MLATTYTIGAEITIKNLLTAYQGEMNTQARYRSYAEQAEAEGLAGVASLFRAAARAEQIHANAQARAIRHLGGTATAVIEIARVEHTLENLRNALDGENYEIARVYPEFVAEASARINAMAARSFQWALEAERTHAQLFGEAIHLIEGDQMHLWIGARRDFLVCPVCACTAKERPRNNCDICNYPADRMEAIR